jgi:hypothetical protein
VAATRASVLAGVRGRSRSPRHRRADRGPDGDATAAWLRSRATPGRGTDMARLPTVPEARAIRVLVEDHELFASGRATELRRSASEVVGQRRHRSRDTTGGDPRSRRRALRRCCL